MFCQLGLGALVAGLRAGLVYNSWPLMGSSIVPGGAFTPKPFAAIFNDLTTAQFDHRMFAYASLGSRCVQAIAALRAGRGPRLRRRRFVAGAALFQAALGIATLVTSCRSRGARHQALALTLFGLAVVHLRATELEATG